MSSTSDKFSLQHLNDLAVNMSRKCSVCTGNLRKSNPGIPCFSCSSKIHAKCTGLRDAKNTFHLHKGNWQCDTCMRDKFPFFDMDDNTRIDLYDDISDTKKFSTEFSIDEKLKILLSQSSKHNWYVHNSDLENDPHDSFKCKLENKPNFHYYSVDDFRKTQETWDRHNSLSTFHTNISSLEGNFYKLDDLLQDLSWNFDVIAVSETWNDEKNKSNFTAPILEGYHKYTGTTGSSQKGGCGAYVRESLSPNPRTDLEFKITDRDAQAENYWFELINDSGPNTLVGVFYRHPSGKIDKFLTALEICLKKVKRENKRTIISGDFNLNLLNFDVDKKRSTIFFVKCWSMASNHVILSLQK